MFCTIAQPGAGEGPDGRDGPGSSEKLLSGTCFKAAEPRYTSPEQLNTKDLEQWHERLISSV